MVNIHLYFSLEYIEMYGIYSYQNAFKAKEIQ